mmetsp:Transcript_45855/g.139275  ORF Transcript_45855/g.139275 Transcript_45855/m.139275 type:complete len:213 (-) Transcript_45855:206-844(-)
MHGFLEIHGPRGGTHQAVQSPRRRPLVRDGPVPDPLPGETLPRADERECPVQRRGRGGPTSGRTRRQGLLGQEVSAVGTPEGPSAHGTMLGDIRRGSARLSIRGEGIGEGGIGPPRHRFRKEGQQAAGRRRRRRRAFFLRGDFVVVHENVPPEEEEESEQQREREREEEEVVVDPHGSVTQSRHERHGRAQQQPRRRCALVGVRCHNLARGG